MFSDLKINNRTYLTYKFLNSLFFGIAVGSYVVQYEPIKMADFPIMGVFFAVLSIPVATLYKKIMRINYFYQFSLYVEVIMIVWIIVFLIFPYSYETALLIYISRNITFVFGDFLGRAETIFLRKTEVLSSLDIAKQLGAISGMIISFCFYKSLEYFHGISDNSSQVYYIHFLLVFIELTIIYFLVRSFRK